MTDPIYEYVKGAGWVPENYETLSRTLFGHKVTLIRRSPRPGEYYFSETGTPLDRTMRNLELYWGDNIAAGNQVGNYHKEGYNPVTLGGPVVVFVE